MRHAQLSPLKDSRRKSQPVPEASLTNAFLAFTAGRARARGSEATGWLAFEASPTSAFLAFALSLALA